jgi:hypothetical protein
MLGISRIVSLGPHIFIFIHLGQSVTPKPFGKSWIFIWLTSYFIPKIGCELRLRPWQCWNITITTCMIWGNSWPI